MRSPTPTGGLETVGSRPGDSRPMIERRQVLQAMGYTALALTGACQRRATPRIVRSAIPRRGGRLRVGELGSSADTLDAARYIADADHLRCIQLYDGLTETDERLQVRMALAEEMTAESPTQWVIRLKRDLLFHHGKPVTADDVIFSIRRIIDPKNPYQGSQGLSMIDADDMQKLDARTVRLRLHRPNSFLPDEFSQIWNPIVPVDFDPRTNPAGTGAYRYKSFTPGSRSVFTRNPDYWREVPYFDEIAVIDFSDDTARLNALVGGEIDVMPSAPHTQMQIAQAAPGITVCNLPSSAWEPFCVRADVEPFNDVRVRQALRLIPDRQQFITQVYNGNARVGNDLFGASDVDYADALPQRRQDLDQAKSLLRAAGHPRLEVELVTSAVSPTLIQAAEVYAEQARGAGVTVRIRRVDPAAFYGPDFLKRPFTQDTWGAFPLMPVISLTLLPGAGDNETGWNDPETLRLIDAARATLDPFARKALMIQLQQGLYERGGYIIPALVNQLSFFSDRVGGLPKPGADAGIDFNFQYRKLWFAA